MDDFPKVKRSIENFLYDEEGNIPRSKILTVGTMMMLLGMVYFQNVHATHSSHSSHSSHQSGSYSDSSSHVSHSSHTSHQSGITTHGSHGSSSHIRIGGPGGTGNGGASGSSGSDGNGVDSSGGTIVDGNTNVTPTPPPHPQLPTVPEINTPNANVLQSTDIGTTVASVGDTLGFKR